MADDDQPTPSDEPAPEPTPQEPTDKPRGAGFDDDEWVRRDLGPRPKVPNHGARPVLMGIPILLITIAAVVAILVAGCGDEEPSATGGATTTTATSASAGSAAGASDADTKKAAAALEAGGEHLAGRMDPEAFTSVSCEPTDGASTGDFRCGVGADDPTYLRVRLQDDGTVTKVLGTVPAAEGTKTSAQTQTLLADDDAATGASNVKYTCATSSAINPDGSSAGSTVSGQRCVLIEGQDKLVGQRYVEFAPDGTASQDFMLAPE